MNAAQPNEVRDLLREVQYPGFSRDIVSAGFVKEITTEISGVVVHFRPNSTNAQKINQMEQGIRDALERADIHNVEVATSLPFNEDDMTLRSPITSESDSDFEIDRAITGDGMMNPLQAELQQDGILPDPDVLRGDVASSEHDPAAGLAQEPPEPFEGPVADGTTYDGVLAVYQWEIDPHDASAESAETSVKIDDWEIRVWWQVHPTGDLVYASLQAMREDWADHVGSARQHPVGRSAAVNLVFDSNRQAVLAIYGTVRDFRPFVEAFRLAYFSQVAQGPTDGEEDES